MYNGALDLLISVLFPLFTRSLPVRMNFNLEHLQEASHKATNNRSTAGSAWPQNELKHILRPHLQLIREWFLGMLYAYVRF